MSEFVVKKQNYRCELIRCCGWSMSDRDEEMASNMMRGRGRRTLKCGNDPDDLLRLVFFYSMEFILDSFLLLLLRQCYYCSHPPGWCVVAGGGGDSGGQ